MKLIVEMPKASQGTVVEWADNMSTGCHDGAIAAGDESDSISNTPLKSQLHPRQTEHAGGGACRAIGCVHNNDFLCLAEGLEVAIQEGRAECTAVQERLGGPSAGAGLVAQGA